MARPDRILVPLLGRPSESEALSYALETFPDADVTVLSVVTPLDAPLSEGRLLERGDDRAAAAAERARELCESVGTRARVEAVEGRPGDVVPRYVTEEGIDHVVLRAPESPGFVRRFLGRGVATTVVDRTPAPVTVLDPDVP